MNKKRRLYGKRSHEYAFTEPVIEHDRDEDGKPIRTWHTGWRDVTGNGRVIAERPLKRRELLKGREPA